jgi:hypothetical protein
MNRPFALRGWAFALVDAVAGFADRSTFGEGARRACARAGVPRFVV